MVVVGVGVVVVVVVSVVVSVDAVTVAGVAAVGAYGEHTSPPAKPTRLPKTSFLQGGNMHVYKATPKEAVGSKGKAGASRYFARAASEASGRRKRYFMEQVRPKILRESTLIP